MHGPQNLISALVGSLTLASLLLVAHPADAARITRVKDTQVLIDLEGSSEFTEGGRYIVVADGKRKAVIEITKAKGGKAIGKVLKGKAVQDGTLQALNGSSSSKKAAAPTSRRTRSRSRSTGDSFSDLTVGALLGLGSASQKVTLTNLSNQQETVSMSGMGFSLKGFADLPISGEFGAIGRVGLEKFGVTGTSQAGIEVKTDIMYLTADLLLRYNFLDGDFKIFPLAGLGLHYPLSKSSDVLNTTQISATTIFFLGAGARYKFSDSMYATGSAELGIFPPSNDVKTSLIAVRGGVGWLL